MRICQFTCACQSTYIVKKERRVHVRISENVPNSAIARHLIDTRHTIDIPQSFKIISKQKKTASLWFAEVVNYYFLLLSLLGLSY